MLQFRKVVYMFYIPPAKWCICDIYHLCQHRENGATSVYYFNYYMYIYMYISVIKNGGAQMLYFMKLKFVLSLLALSVKWIKGIQKPILIIICQRKAYPKRFYRRNGQKSGIIVLFRAHFW